MSRQTNESNVRNWQTAMEAQVAKVEAFQRFKRTWRGRLWLLTCRRPLRWLPGLPRKAMP